MLIADRGNGEILLERRPPAGIWGGLWCLPAADDLDHLASLHGVILEALEPLGEIEHRLTHRLLRIIPLKARTMPAAERVECRQDQSWNNRQQWRQLGLPRPVADLLEKHTSGDDA